MPTVNKNNKRENLKKKSENEEKIKQQSSELHENESFLAPINFV